MGDRGRSFLRDLGAIIQVPGYLALVSVPVAIGFDEWHYVPGFLLEGLLGAGGGLLLYRGFRRGHERGQALPLVTVAASWLVVGVLGGLPFWVGALWASADGMPLSATTLAFAHPSNALFEGVSGFTGTGLTVATDPSELPRSLQWWRSVMEWVGGLGVAILALLVARPSVEAEDLTDQEMSLGAFARLGHPLRRLWAIYAALTVAAMGTFWVVGVPAWEAINHGITAISTGGFSITPDSFQSYGAGPKLVAMGCMVAGAVSLPVYYGLVRRRSVRLLVDRDEVRWFAGALVIGAALSIGLEALRRPETPLLDVAFQWFSALCTCGFSALPADAFGEATLFVFVSAMFVGAMSGSTAGGVKTRRFVALWRGARELWSRAASGEASVQEALYSADDAERLARAARAGAFAITFLGALLVGTVALAVLVEEPRPLLDVLYEAASALGCVGLSTGITGPELGWGPKLVLMALMWAGRLEVVAVLALLIAPVWWGRKG